MISMHPRFHAMISCLLHLILCEHALGFARHFLLVHDPFGRRLLTPGATGGCGHEVGCFHLAVKGSLQLLRAWGGSFGPDVFESC